MWSQFTNVTDRQTDRRTDRQTTCDRNTALCTKVHRAVKSKQHKIQQNKTSLVRSPHIRPLASKRGGLILQLPSPLGTESVGDWLLEDDWTVCNTSWPSRLMDRITDRNTAQLAGLRPASKHVTDFYTVLLMQLLPELCITNLHVKFRLISNYLICVMRLFSFELFFTWRKLTTMYCRDGQHVMRPPLFVLSWSIRYKYLAGSFRLKIFVGKARGNF